MSEQQPPLEKEITALVRQVVARTLGGGGSTADGQGQPAHTRRPLLDENMVRDMPAGSTQQLAADTIITPLARQAALERRIRLEPTSNLQSPISQSPNLQSPISTSPTHTIAIGADHGGYTLKEQLKTLLAANYQLIDCGTHSTAAVDYPDIAYAVARLVANGRAANGIIIDGAGIGSCMVANKVPGVRAAMCYDHASAANSREHNHANVLTLGAGLIGPNLARQIVETWLATEFGSGRHAKRVDKIDQLDKRYTRS